MNKFCVHVQIMCSSRLDHDYSLCLLLALPPTEAGQLLKSMRSSHSISSYTRANVSLLSFWWVGREWKFWFAFFSYRKDDTFHMPRFYLVIMGHTHLLYSWAGQLLACCLLRLLMAL